MVVCIIFNAQLSYLELVCMNSNIDPSLIAVCGMNCTLCSSYLALKNDLKTKGLKMPYCTGCRLKNKNCSFLKKHCTKLSANEVSFCFECASFPCENLKKIDSQYAQRYHMSMIKNLQFIKANGLEKFIDQQMQTWKCPTCNGLICCHNGLCYSCQLQTLKNKEQKYRW